MATLHGFLRPAPQWSVLQEREVLRGDRPRCFPPAAALASRSPPACLSYCPEHDSLLPRDPTDCGLLHCHRYYLYFTGTTMYCALRLVSPIVEPF
ncbi:hypothetical protein BT67DRAFT_193865 [Trichocladium antarcticum]|uniref:Uncharacterized protein n=1 Tax=Trichocladium antarcticum TaxID=1450529 RepID=A0AAN6ZGM3_9PEZI|nr:hypothetical protein BT67DRAFT_193865 [Trichocladium antarcticum]